MFKNFFCHDFAKIYIKIELKILKGNFNIFEGSFILVQIRKKKDFSIESGSTGLNLAIST
jgi:hypothetical protein